MPGQWKMTLNIEEVKIILLYYIMCSLCLIHWLSSKLFSFKQRACTQSAHINTQSCSKIAFLQIHSNLFYLTINSVTLTCEFDIYNHVDTFICLGGISYRCDYLIVHYLMYIETCVFFDINLKTCLATIHIVQTENHLSY